MVNGEQVYRGILDCFARTYKAGGIRGLYRGVGMPIKPAHTTSTSMIEFKCWFHIPEIFAFNSWRQLHPWLGYFRMRV